MKLTRRQEEFINNLHALSQELMGPIHYTILAERLGVSPFTAYDMLCLLEEKGFVTSEYRLSGEKSGPGRAERVFIPNFEAHTRRLRILMETDVQLDTKQGISQVILERMRNGELPENELHKELMARIPPDDLREELRFCMEIMAIIAFRLRQKRGQQILTQYLTEIIPQNNSYRRSNLCFLGGFAFGILANEYSSNSEWVDKLFEHMIHYHEIVANLNQEECNRLGNYIVGLFSPTTQELVDNYTNSSSEIDRRNQ